jgi:hypothetical protein
MSASDSPPRSRRLIASRRWCGVSLGGRPIICPRATARARPSPVAADKVAETAILHSFVGLSRSEFVEVDPVARRFTGSSTTAH